MITIDSEELLDYVIERDFEDTAARVILSALRDAEPIGKVKFCTLLRGRNPYMFRGRDHMIRHWGKLQQFDRDQVLDMIEALVRMGHITAATSMFGSSVVLSLTARGNHDLKHSQPIPMQIPWPLPAKDFPQTKEVPECQNP